MKGFPTITGGELGVEEERQNNKSRYAVLMLDMNTYAHTKKKKSIKTMCFSDRDSCC